MQTLFPTSKWIMIIIGLFYVTGCANPSRTPTGPNNSEPQNDVYFTVEGSDANAQITIQRNGTSLFYGAVTPPWTSDIIIGRRNNTFLMRICDSIGNTFSMRMYLNNDEIESFTHQNGNSENQCSDLSVTLDEEYDDLLNEQ